MVFGQLLRSFVVALRSSTRRRGPVVSEIARHTEQKDSSQGRYWFFQQASWGHEHAEYVHAASRMRETEDAASVAL